MKLFPLATPLRRSFAASAVCTIISIVLHTQKMILSLSHSFFIISLLVILEMNERH